jgi:hypothetical protein
MAQVAPDADVTLTKQEANPNRESDTSGITPFAVPFYTPETSFGLGVAAVLYSYLDERKSRKPSELEFELIGTAKKQVEANLRGRKFFQLNTYALWLNSRVSTWPDKFYGTGPDVSDDNREEYKQNALAAQSAFLRRFLADVYAGPVCSVHLATITDKKANGLLATGGYRGSNGLHASGCGIQLEHESLDRPFYPHQGGRLLLQALFYRSWLGSDYGFEQYAVDYRRFLQIRGDHVLAGQLRFLSSYGDTPWQMLGRLGGFELMRGYEDNKFRDSHYLAAQLEYRFPIIWRLGGVVFGSAGRVAGRLGDLSVHGTRLAFGLGLRGVVDWEEHIPFRLDLAFDAALNPNVYFGLLEAF